MFDSLIDFLKELILDLLEGVKEIFIWVVEWIKEVVLSILIPILEGLGSLIPDGWNDGIETGLTWLGYINCWVPVVFGIQMFVAYYTIKTTLNVVKWVLKAIPTVWG